MELKLKLGQVLIYGFDLQFCGDGVESPLTICKDAGESCQSPLKCLICQQNH